MELVIATSNLHKLREFRSLLKPVFSGDLLSLSEFPDYIPPQETGSTFEENAILKAVHAATSLNRWVLADDSGLVVPSLLGAPGVYSARYAGKGSSDLENRKKLLREMASFTEERRNAYFECWIALASPSGLKKSVNAKCEGSIIFEDRGGLGFGYDPIFLKHDYNKTFSELDEETKNRISHRGKALNKLLPTLENLLQTA